ncbi:MAG: hypothetical protein EBE86_002485 [Hormoscilla sp. GUM202]|nr:hypothetical protein [Hormoscilla sp. GUM202]
MDFDDLEIVKMGSSTSIKIDDSERIMRDRKLSAFAGEMLGILPGIAPEQIDETDFV